MIFACAVYRANDVLHEITEHTHADITLDSI
jgi:hypothetical protein